MERETAMKILKELHGKSLFAARTALETIFPELKESEDERIKRNIIAALKGVGYYDCDLTDECIAWLEKQGEQKPVGKPKLKFKVGDVVCKKKDNSFCATINSITDTVYLCDVFDSDGDYDDDYAFLISEQDEYELVAKKIEDEIEIPFGAKDSELQEETYYIPKGFHAEIDDDKVVIKKGEKPAAWSEKDEKMLHTIIADFKGFKHDNTSTLESHFNECIDWLKSIKDIVQPQPKQEWSEEDENYLQSAENACEYQYSKNTSTILWLKSLKDRIGGKTWQE